MDFETLIRDEQAGLTRRLASVLGGDRHAAEDLSQEAFVRAWRRLPRELDSAAQRAWLRRTADNLAIDELRRRLRRPAAHLDSAAPIAAAVSAPEPDGAREALARLDPHERFVLLLRFSGGLRHGEIARLLDISEEAARKRVARARQAFVAAYRATRSNPRPQVLVIARDESSEPYLRWLERAGASAREITGRPSERDLVLADAVVLSGAFRDVHSALYGEEPRSLRGDPDLAMDRGDIAVLRAALALDMPIVGVCRGHQLLNIVSGGTLYQDVVADGLTGASHEDGCHVLRTDGDTASRRLVGRAPQVDSAHHQAIRRLGRGVRATARSRDGVIEMIEREDRRFAMGMQWHPECGGARGDAIADAMVAAIAAAA